MNLRLAKRITIIGYTVVMLLASFLPYFWEENGFHWYLYDYPELFIPYLGLTLITILAHQSYVKNNWKKRLIRLWIFASIICSLGLFFDLQMYRAEHITNELGFPIYLLISLGPISVLYYLMDRFHNNTYAKNG